MNMVQPAVRRPVWYVACSLIAVLFLAPILWSILTSLKLPAEANASPPELIPSRLSAENYVALLGYGGGIMHYFGNSLIVASLTVIGIVILSTLAGYGFSRFKFPLKGSLFLTLLVTLMVPFQSILTPLFLVLRVLHLQNSLLGLALVNITFQLPFSIFMLRNSFDGIPRELDDAAAIDGCNSLRLLLRVLLPVAMPGLVSVALFAFLASWNEFLAALIFLTDSDKFTLPVMLLNAQSGYLGTIDWGLMQAGITLTMLPCAILFLLLQRYYVRGLISGAIK
ncbi:MAG: carbohydrate ABC transporter permease [Verrucomicrobia bacterium]|nr:carbohydrate ABC transporter permease [Verrucomicrobiota bacterium]